jgi:arsenical pump membrane protein
MWLPTLIAAILNIILLYLFFRKDISKKFKLNKKEYFLVKNWNRAILKSSLILLMLITLIFSEKLYLDIWLISSFFALLFLILDIFPYLYNKLVKNKKIYKNVFIFVNKKMPWMILPFIIIFFIIISQISSYGFIDWLAVNLSNFSTNLEKGIFINGIMAFLLANIVNNQPMSILFSNIFINHGFQVSDLVFKGSVYAVILASNLGANLTLMGALAGLMWSKILKNKGLKISYLEFFKVAIFITPVVFIFSLLSLIFILNIIS